MEMSGESAGVHGKKRMILGGGMLFLKQDMPIGFWLPPNKDQLDVHVRNRKHVF